MLLPFPLFWVYLAVELLAFVLVSNLLGFVFAFLLLVGLTIYGGQLFRKTLMNMTTPVQQGEQGYRLVGAILLVIPGFATALLALCLLWQPLRDQWAKEIWARLKPEDMYQRYGEQFESVMAQRADGTRIQGELLRKDKP